MAYDVPDFNLEEPLWKSEPKTKDELEWLRCNLPESDDETDLEDDNCLVDRLKL